MTKHEWLKFLSEKSGPNYAGGLTAYEIADKFNYALSSVYGMLSRWRSQGLVWRKKKQGYHYYTFYGITKKGRFQLAYFEEYGCGSLKCSLC